jgi:hypothetical protein
MEVYRTREQIVGLNVAMGYLGVAYILSAFVSMGLQMKDSIYMISSFKNDFIGVTHQIGGDMGASINTIRSPTGNIPRINKQ